MTDNERDQPRRRFEASEVKKQVNADWPQTNWASPLLKGAWVRVRRNGEVYDGRVLGKRSVRGGGPMAAVLDLAGLGLHAARAADGPPRTSTDPGDRTKLYVPMVLWPVHDSTEITAPGDDTSEWWVRASWKQEQL
ncbi:hypothetical protein OG984_16055 [Nocardioides sp. NBC_00368]|uniref:hypothetical protein n=1 Tax=Nocardioides sp. NBC_00368 TaxID=2976000 RepID=UPI002E23F585